MSTHLNFHSANFPCRPSYKQTRCSSLEARMAIYELGTWIHNTAFRLSAAWMARCASHLCPLNYRDEQSLVDLVAYHIALMCRCKACKEKPMCLTYSHFVSWAASQWRFGNFSFFLPHLLELAKRQEIIAERYRSEWKIVCYIFSIISTFNPCLCWKSASLEETCHGKLILYDPDIALREADVYLNS